MTRWLRYTTTVGTTQAEGEWRTLDKVCADISGRTIYEKWLKKYREARATKFPPSEGFAGAQQGFRAKTKISDFLSGWVNVKREIDWNQAISEFRELRASAQGSAGLLYSDHLVFLHQQVQTQEIALAGTGPSILQPEALVARSQALITAEGDSVDGRREEHLAALLRDLVKWARQPTYNAETDRRITKGLCKPFKNDTRATNELLAHLDALDAAAMMQSATQYIEKLRPDFRVADWEARNTMIDAVDGFVTRTQAQTPHVAQYLQNQAEQLRSEQMCLQLQQLQLQIARLEQDNAVLQRSTGHVSPPHAAGRPDSVETAAVGPSYVATAVLSEEETLTSENVCAWLAANEAQLWGSNSRQEMLLTLQTLGIGQTFSGLGWGEVDDLAGVLHNYYVNAKATGAGDKLWLKDQIDSLVLTT